jgi:triacylglycerol lipase
MNIAFASGVLAPQKFLGVDYFLGFAQHFKNSDVRALFPSVPVTASIAHRADALADELTGSKAKEKFEPDKKIHIIAHSMGGLDARLLISRNLKGLRDRIASLTTLCTPHEGSLAADFLTGHEPPLLDPKRVIFDLIRMLSRL